MTRDELARHLYIHSHDVEGAPPPWTLQQWQEQGRRDWDDGSVKPGDVEAFYAYADRMIANGEIPR